MNTVTVPKILLPPENTDMTKWSVIACDQFTSQPDYWNALSDYVGGAPSTLKMILPEARLGKNADADASEVNSYMCGTLPLMRGFEGFVSVKRTLNNGLTREGIVLAVDLEAYDYSPKNDADIKATEKTVEERLPIRVQIRRNAPMELPHIMLLFDDPEDAVMRAAKAAAGEKLYGFELNMNGGVIEGRAITDCGAVVSALESTRKDFLFAVGDGNHSLAAAKECWNLIKKDLNAAERKTHPARYALCEAVNLRDESLVFEPIHRIVTGVDEDFVEGLSSLRGSAKIEILSEKGKREISVAENPADAIADIQNYIDDYIAERGGKCDYIHGGGNLVSVREKLGGVAIFMPTLKKDGLFDYAARRGVLPRKSFSMGEAEDKRYYLEARKIIY